LKFIAILLNAHYRNDYCEALTELLERKLLSRKGKTQDIAERRLFIFFCKEAIGVLDPSLFTKYFLDELIAIPT
jgi:hypothetical protein